jgi:hypothetical protein
LAIKSLRASYDAVAEVFIPHFEKGNIRKRWRGKRGGRDLLTLVDRNAHYAMNLINHGIIRMCGND